MQIGDRTIGFLGAGKMATALAGGWIKAGLVKAEQIRASDPFDGAREYFHAQTTAPVTDDNVEVLEHCEILILAVKPQVMTDLLNEMKGRTEKHLLVSIAAGVTLAQMQKTLGACRLIRVMPNTPCLVGAMAAGYSPSAEATKEDIALIDTLLNAVGKAFRVSESLLDAVTGLSGSGPAFVAVMIEALADGGVRAGLPRNIAHALAVQTVFGTAKLIEEMDHHPAQLKDMVTSPGGTTIAGIHAMEAAGVRAALMDAVVAATERSRELGKS